ncbi:MAG: molybdate ABC transporter substrate-binding protein [Pseudomonadales bacterium]
MLLLVVLNPTAARADQVLVAVAANFSEVLDGLSVEFERRTGHRVGKVVGSTGKLFAQISHGAPFDVFLAADQARPEILEQRGLGVAGSRFTYASGRLTLWSADPQLLAGSGAEVLATPAVRHVAIANPDLAPYGAAARQALQCLGLWDVVAPRLVRAQNIGETFAMVATGNAAAGFVALSSVLSPRNEVSGSRWDVPPDCYDPIRQDAILLERARDNAAARVFLDFLGGDGARALIVSYGYRAD